MKTVIRLLLLALVTFCSAASSSDQQKLAPETQTTDSNNDVSYSVSPPDLSSLDGVRYWASTSSSGTGFSYSTVYRVKSSNSSYWNGFSGGIGNHNSSFGYAINSNTDGKEGDN